MNPVESADNHTRCPSTFPPFFSAWYMDVISGALAAIFDHEATQGWKPSLKDNSVERKEKLNCRRYIYFSPWSVYLWTSFMYAKKNQTKTKTKNPEFG